MSNICKLPLDGINATGGTQSRAELNQATVAEYAEALGHGAEFPPVIVFSDGAAGGNWLADGFHRYHAHRAAGLAEISCDLRIGTLRDAKLFAAGANGTHGLRRTNADKRQAVAMVLTDAEWQAKPETWLADACRVSRTLVRSMLEELHLVEKHDAVRTVERNGKTYEMNTAQIGKPSAPAPAAPAAPTAPAVLPNTAPGAAPAPSNLVRQVLEQQASAGAAPAPEPAPEPEPEPETEVGVDNDAHDEVDPFDRLLGDFHALQREHDKAAARVKELENLLAKNDLAAQVDTLALKCAQFDSLATSRFNDIAERDETIGGQRKFLDDLRKAAGLPKGGDLMAWVKAAGRRAA